MKERFGKGERVVSREGEIEFKGKIMLYFFREAKCMQGLVNLIIVEQFFGLS